MDDTPDTAQRLAEIRRYWDVYGHVVGIGDMMLVFDHIDTLTAKLAEVEADRDALREAVADYHNDDHDPETIERDNKWLHVLRLAGCLA
jgi:hypothetical protein